VMLGPEHTQVIMQAEVPASDRKFPALTGRSGTLILNGLVRNGRIVGPDDLPQVFVACLRKVGAGQRR
jgi:hypothetical protein